MVDGTSYGFLLFLVASGMTLSLGLMRTLNVAHGALFMLGGYIGWTLTSKLGTTGFFLSFIVAGAVAAAVSLIVQVLILERLRYSLVPTVLATFGVLLVLETGTQLLWGSTPRSGMIPGFLGGVITIAGARTPVMELAAIVLGVVFLVAVGYLIARTRGGLMVTASIDDGDIASSLGINVNAVMRGSFMAGSALAGIAGAYGQMVMGLNTQEGLTVLLLALIVVVIGGIGSLTGALVAALALGWLNSFGVTAFPALESIVPYCVLIVVLVIRPSGLFGRMQTRAA